MIKIKQLPHLFRREPREAVIFALGAWQLAGMWCELTCPSWSRGYPSLGVMRVSLHGTPLSGLARQHRNLCSALRQNNQTTQMGRRRGFNYCFPPLPVLSSPTQKLICEQTQHFQPKEDQTGGCLAAARISDVAAVCSNTLTCPLEWPPPCLCGKAYKIASIKFLQLPLTRLPIHIFHLFLTEASV